MYCVREVLCVFSQCAAKGRSVSEVSMLNGGRGTPSTAGRRRPPPAILPSLPIESTEAECSGHNKTGAKGFVSGSLP